MLKLMYNFKIGCIRTKEMPILTVLITKITSYGVKGNINSLDLKISVYFELFLTAILLVTIVFADKRCLSFSPLFSISASIF